jgi:hypothetical protein
MLLNTVPIAWGFGEVRPCLVLRFSIHLPDEMDKVVEAFKTGRTHLHAYTGGTASDELASLIALTHGVRVAAGSANRWFNPHDKDPRGRPVELVASVPAFETTRTRARVPTLYREVVLSDHLLGSFPRLEADTARELVRASRSYRQACWICEADPNLAWLLYVSAVETAASEWARLLHLPQISERDLLSELRPDFADKLSKAAGDKTDAVLNEVGKTLGNVLRAQWKFINFLLEFGLVPPSPRPKALPLDWSKDAMKESLSIVYKHRSHALHASQPFPPPMSDPPFPTEGTDGQPALGERPGGSAYTIGGLWADADLPMNLCTFQHIVRSALLRWWESVLVAPA